MDAASRATAIWEHLRSLEVDASLHKPREASSTDENDDEAVQQDVEATAVVARYEETLQLLSEDVKQLSMKIGVLSHDEQRLLVQEVTPHLVLCLSAHVGEHYWTTSVSRRMGRGVLGQVVSLCGCISIIELLIGWLGSRDSCLLSHDNHVISPYTPMTTRAESTHVSSTQDCSKSERNEIESETLSHDNHVTSPFISMTTREESTHELTENVLETSCDKDYSQIAGEEREKRELLFSSGIIKPLLALLRSRLTKESWKKQPVAKHALVWTLRQLKHPHLSPHLPSFLPPLLMLLDDYESYHKVLGLSAVTHLINNIDPSELRRYGRADVIYEAVKSMLYLREEAVIHALHGCLLHLLPVMVGPQPVSVTAPRKPTKTDEVFRILLNNIDFESRIALRKAYVAHLSDYINLLGIYTTRHMKQVLKVIAECLQFPDYTGEETRQSSLTALNTLMRHTWPRVPYHRDMILKMLLKLVSDLCPDDAIIPDKPEIKHQLELVSKCMVTLYHCCGDTLEDVYRSIQRGCVHRGLLSCLETSLVDMDRGQS